jgi:hypothetical protein
MVSFAERIAYRGEWITASGDSEEHRAFGPPPFREAFPAIVLYVRAEWLKENWNIAIRLKVPRYNAIE